MSGTKIRHKSDWLLRETKFVSTQPKADGQGNNATSYIIHALYAEVPASIPSTTGFPKYGHK